MLKKIFFVYFLLALMISTCNALPQDNTRGIAKMTEVTASFSLQTDRDANWLLASTKGKGVRSGLKQNEAKHNRLNRKFSRKNAHHTMEAHYQRLMHEFEWQSLTLTKLIEKNISEML